MLEQLIHDMITESSPNTHAADIHVFNRYVTNIGLDTVSHKQTTTATDVDGDDGGESYFLTVIKQCMSF